MLLTRCCKDWHLCFWCFVDQGPGTPLAGRLVILAEHSSPKRSFPTYSFFECSTCYLNLSKSELKWTERNTQSFAVTISGFTMPINVASTSWWSNRFPLSVSYMNETKWSRGSSNKFESKVMFIWAPVQRFMAWAKARLGYSKQKDDSNPIDCCRRVVFPMGSYGAPTLKFTVLLSGKYVKLIVAKQLCFRLHPMRYVVSWCFVCTSGFGVHFLVWRPSRGRYPSNNSEKFWRGWYGWFHETPNTYLREILINLYTLYPNNIKNVKVITSPSPNLPDRNTQKPNLVKKTVDKQGRKRVASCSYLRDLWYYALQVIALNQK